MDENTNASSCGCGGAQVKTSSSCCGSALPRAIITAGGPVKRVDSTLTSDDRRGAVKVRLGIGRDRYRVDPGLYAIGQPDETSPVFVSANYKLSFDVLRKNLNGISGWILVLDTRGINVWCAAGKGTFGTEELVKRIKATSLADVVVHNRIIVPQLGAPGVSEQTVRQETGFSVVWGPVRADDIPAFLRAGMKADANMRRVTFPLRDRMVLTPVEFFQSIRFSGIILAAVLLISFVAGWNNPVSSVVLSAIGAFLPFLGAVVVATIFFPMLLPLLPGRAFSLKGWFLGLLWSILYGGLFFFAGGRMTWQNILPVFLIAPPIVSFITLNFTGATTFTSLSGVVKEMRFSIPAIACSAAVGTAALVLGRFIFA